MTGWGRTTEEGEAATTLQKAHIPVVTDTKCRQVGVLLVSKILVQTALKKEGKNTNGSKTIYQFLPAISNFIISDNNTFRLH